MKMASRRAVNDEVSDIFLYEKSLVTWIEIHLHMQNDAIYSKCIEHTYKFSHLSKE